MNGLYNTLAGNITFPEVRAAIERDPPAWRCDGGPGWLYVSGSLIVGHVMFGWTADNSPTGVFWSWRTFFCGAPGTVPTIEEGKSMVEHEIRRRMAEGGAP